MSEILETTTIQTKRKTRDRIDKFGTRHDSYDTIINRVIGLAEEYQSKKGAIRK